MAQGKSGSFELAGTKGMTLKVFWSETYDIETNTSNVSITGLQLKSASYGATYYLTGTVSIGGKTVASFDSKKGYDYFTVNSDSVYKSIVCDKAPPPWSVSNILHDSDGSKSVGITISVKGYTTSGQYGSGWEVNTTHSVELTTIARVSVPTVSTTDVTMGGQVTITTNRKSAALTHTLTYSFAGSTGTIATGVGDSYSWTVPDLTGKISGATSGKCTITCQTYAGSTHVGSRTVEIVLRVPDASKPTVSKDTVQMGTSVTVNTNRRSAAFTHEITYKIGSKTDVVSGSVGVSVSWTPPKDLAAYTGNKTSAKCTITCKTYNGSALVGTTTVEITLTVPSATKLTLNASSVALGKVLTIGTPGETTAYTHDLTYYIAGVDGTIATDVSSEYKWTVPIALAAKIPEKTSAAVTVICTTRFKGSTAVVGTSSATFTATVPNNETTRPKVKMTAECVSNLPSKFAGIYVVGKSKVKVSYEASSDYSAIDSYSTTVQNVTGGGNPYTSAPLSVAGKVAITGLVEDKRGYSTTVTDSISVEPYSRPRIIPIEGQNNIICKRCNSNGDEDPGGVYLLIKIGRKYSPVGSKNSCKLSYRHKTDAAGEDAYSAPIELLAASAASDYVTKVIANVVPSNTTAYTIQLIAEDDVGEKDTVIVTIPTAFITAHAPDGGHGFTLGGYHDPSKVDWFVCYFDAEFKGEVRGIYSSGETDGWTWRKYSDGIAECWRRVSQVVDITNSKGYMYYGACQDISFPFTFKDVPVCHTSVECMNILMIGSYGKASTTKPAQICVFKPEDANQEESLTVVYHAIGRWK